MTMTSSGIDTTYNGWTNYETWNVALYIGNDEGLYSIACDYVRDIRRHNMAVSYEDFAQSLQECGGYITPDGVSWTHPTLDIDELNEMLEELVEVDD